MLYNDEKLGNNENLREFGLESFMASEYYTRNDKLSEIVIENMYIDTFLKQYSDFSTIQGETTIEREIQKAVTINKLLNQEEFGAKEEGRECLEILIEHLDTNLKPYKKYLEENGIDWSQKEEELDQMLEPLGLDCEFIGKEQEPEIMGMIEDNNDIKYATQLRKFFKMAITKIDMEAAGIEDSKFEENYTELLETLVREISPEYLSDLAHRECLEKLTDMRGAVTKYFIGNAYDPNTGKRLSLEERIAVTEERINKSFIEPEVEAKRLEEFYRQVGEKEDLYAVNEMGKSTVYANLEIKLKIGSEIQRGTEEPERQPEQVEARGEE